MPPFTYAITPFFGPQKRCSADQNTNICAGKLLRLRKKLLTTAPCQIAQTNYESFVKPHFRSCDIIDQCLVEIGSSGIITVLNQELKKWEMMPWEFQSPSMALGRPTKRQGVYLADDNHCLLVQDMTPGIQYLLLMRGAA
jgi:hypothetical protein